MIGAIMGTMALLPPNVPPPPERTTPLPAYSAKCRLTGRDARDHRLSVAISGVGESRRAVFSKGSGPLNRLAALDEKSTVTSFGNSEILWDTVDFIKADFEGKSVTVWLEVKPDPTEGAAIKIKDASEQFGLPLFAGMCRTKPIEASSSS